MSLEAAAAAETAFSGGEFLMQHGGIMLASVFCGVAFGFDPVSLVHGGLTSSVETVMPPGI